MYREGICDYNKTDISQTDISISMPFIAALVVFCLRELYHDNCAATAAAASAACEIRRTAAWASCRIGNAYYFVFIRFTLSRAGKPPLKAAAP